MSDPGKVHATEHATHGHGVAHPPAEEDRIQSRTIVFVGVGALVLFFIASLAAIGSMRRQQRELLPEGPAPLPAELGSAKIGIVEQRLFENSNQAASLRAAQARMLETYGWVDPAQGVIRMPVARGVEMVLRGERPKASPPLAGGVAGPRVDVGTGQEPPGAEGPAMRPPVQRPTAPSQRSPIGGVRE